MINYVLCCCVHVSAVTLQGISRVCQLWDPSRDSSRGGQAKMGAQLHIAQMAALRAAGRHKDVSVVRVCVGGGSRAF